MSGQSHLLSRGRAINQAAGGAGRGQRRRGFLLAPPPHVRARGALHVPRLRGGRPGLWGPASELGGPSAASRVTGGRPGAFQAGPEPRRNAEVSGSGPLISVRPCGVPPRCAGLSFPSR